MKASGTVNSIECLFLLGQGPDPRVKSAHYGNESINWPPIDGPNAVDLGGYVRADVTNVDHPTGRAYFDLGVRLMHSYQHEKAFHCFLACLEKSPYCVLAHGFVALCHSPNYNFKGDAYYESAHHPNDALLPDLYCVFPSQQVADRHSKAAIDKIEYIRKLHRKSKGGGGGGGGKGKKKGKGKGRGNKGNNNNGHCNDNDKAEGESPNGDTENAKEFPPQMVSDLETKLLMAIRTLCCQPGLDPGLSEEMVGRPYANDMRKAYEKYPDDPDVAYCFAESLMVLNAWQLFEFPTGKPVSPDVTECAEVRTAQELL